MYNGRNIAAVFDGSYEGLLTVIHAHYYDKLNPVQLVPEDRYQQTLDTEYLYIATDYAKADQVILGIRKKFAPESEQHLFSAFLSEEAPYMELYRYALLAFKMGRSVDAYEQLDYVLKVHKLSRYVSHEAHLLTGFCRFVETDTGILYADISPVNHVITLLAEHFKDRLMNQSWLIHDVKRGIAAAYDGRDYAIESVPKNAQVVWGAEEEKFQALWRTFFDTIGVKERHNKKCQQNHLPLRFRSHMTEFKGAIPKPRPVP